MSKYNSKKDYRNKLYKAQVKKTINGGGNSNTFWDYVVSPFSKSKRQEITTIDKAEKRGYEIRAEINQRSENNKNVNAKVGNYNKKESSSYSSGYENYESSDYTDYTYTNTPNPENINRVVNNLPDNINAPKSLKSIHTAKHKSCVTIKNHR